VRAAAIAVVNEAGGGVVESSVEVVARTLTVELARAVRNVRSWNISCRNVIM
jgi:hypothetical protein